MDDKIEYRHGSNRAIFQDSEWLTPTVADWSAFRRKMDRVDVWSWGANYTNADVLDGTSWNVVLVFPDRCVRSSGSNDYPAHFQTFLRAVRALIGDRTFE